MQGKSAGRGVRRYYAPDSDDTCSGRRSQALICEEASVYLSAALRPAYAVVGDRRHRGPNRALPRPVAVNANRV